MLNVFSAKCHQGQDKTGVANGPDLLIKELKGVNNHACVEEKEFDDPLDGCNVLYDMMNLMENDNMNLVIGGDHTIAAGSVAHSLNRWKDDLVVVWIDAHMDINTMITSDSGHLHGMPVSSLMGIDKQWVDHHVLQPEKLIYVGLRDVDDPEVEFLDKYKMDAYWMEDIRRITMNKVVEQIEHKIKHKKIHVSFDIDGLDPSIASATGTPVSSGLTLDEITELFDLFKKYKHNVVCLDVVELNPELGNIDVTMNTLRHILKDFVI
jgi:arginase